jgi:hypothetical protein
MLKLWQHQECWALLFSMQRMPSSICTAATFLVMYLTPVGSGILSFGNVILVKIGDAFPFLFFNNTPTLNKY